MAALFMGAVTSASASPFWTAVAAACSDSKASTPASAVCLPNVTSGATFHIVATVSYTHLTLPTNREV